MNHLPKDAPAKYEAQVGNIKEENAGVKSLEDNLQLHLYLFLQVSFGLLGFFTSHNVSVVWQREFLS